MGLLCRELRSELWMRTSSKIAFLMLDLLNAVRANHFAHRRVSLQPTPRCECITRREPFHRHGELTETPPDASGRRRSFRALRLFLAANRPSNEAAPRHSQGARGALVVPPLNRRRLDGLCEQFLESHPPQPRNCSHFD